MIGRDTPVEKLRRPPPPSPRNCALTVQVSTKLNRSHVVHGREALIPFVEALVPTVDLDAGRVVVDPPHGLLDLAE